MMAMRALVAGLALLAVGTGRPPSLSAACSGDSGIGAQALWLETSDHVRLYAIEAGHGPVTVVLAHEGNSDLCPELPYAKTLLDAGLRVLAFDFRGNGDSASSPNHPDALGRDLAAAVARAHDSGAHVFLIGASMGGASAVNNSGGLPLAGVISLSGTVLWPGYGINKPGPRALRAPFLYLGSRDDWRAPVKQAQSVFREVSSKDKEIFLYAGALHGWDLVQAAPFAAKARATILSWMKRHSR